MTRSVDNRKYGKLADMTFQFRDVENTIFTDYVAREWDKLVKEAMQIDGLDREKARDLVHDTWVSYQKNEEDNKCFDMNKVHGEFFDTGLQKDTDEAVRVAVVARMKLMSRNRDIHSGETKYLKNTSSKVVLTGFNETNSEEDELQFVLSNAAKQDSLEIAEMESADNLKQNMMYFVACTADCRIAGVDLLDKMETVIKLAEQPEFKSSLPTYIGDIWNKASDIKETFESILKEYYHNREAYYDTLNLVKEEDRACREMLKNHPVAVRQERELCRNLLREFTSENTRQ